MTTPTDRPTAVLIHGGATTARCWDLVRDRITGSLAVNVPGREDRPADLGTLTVDQAARSLAADIEAAGPARVVLVAHSSAGASARPAAPTAWT
jgi:pimeloyl-ACP methyl ester carboxylesterase